MLRRLTIFCILALFTLGAAQEIELNVWAPGGFTPASGLVEVAEAYQDLYDRFQEENPSITLNWQTLAGGTEALQQVLAAAAANNLPDVGIMDGFWIPRLVERGVLQPLNALWPEDVRADYDPAVIDSVSIDGDIYAVWFYNAWRGLYYREDILEEIGYDAPPQDWDSFIEMGQRIRDELGMWAVMLPGASGEGTTLHILAMFFGLGGDLVDETGTPVFFEGENRAALEQVYQVYYDLVHTYDLMPASVATMDESAIRNFFFGDEVAIVAQSSSSLVGIFTSRPDFEGNLGAINYPLPGGQVPVPNLVGWTWAVFADDPARQQAAWDFVDFMTNTENLGRMNELMGQLPIRDSIWESRTFFAEDRLFGQFKTIYEAGGMRPRPPVPIYPVISSSISLQMAEVLSGNLTPSEAVDAARDLTMAEWERMQDR